MAQCTVLFGGRLRRLEQQLARVRREQDSLSETVDRGGAVQAVIDALARRDGERQQIEADIAALFLGEWQTALTNNPSEPHGVLDTVLADRIRFAPDPEHRGYTLTLPVAF